MDPLAVDLSPGKCVFVGSVEQSQEETDNKSILGALTDEGQTSATIAETIGRPAGTVRTRLENLYKEQLAKREGDGKRSDPFLYSKLSFCTEKSLSAETNPAEARWTSEL